MILLYLYLQYISQYPRLWADQGQGEELLALFKQAAEPLPARSIEIVPGPTVRATSVRFAKLGLVDFIVISV